MLQFYFFHFGLNIKDYVRSEKKFKNNFFNDHRFRILNSTLLILKRINFRFITYQLNSLLFTIVYVRINLARGLKGSKNQILASLSHVAHNGDIFVLEDNPVIAGCAKATRERNRIAIEDKK